MKAKHWTFFLVPYTCVVIYLCYRVMSKSRTTHEIYSDKKKYVWSKTIFPHKTSTKEGKVNLMNMTTPIGHHKHLTLPYPPTVVDEKDINPDIAKYFTFAPNETKDTFTNLHQYKFNLASQVCTKRDLLLIMVIHSSTTNFKKRKLVRRTFGSVHTYKGNDLGLVFILGATENPSVQNQINDESKRFGDIVQGNFLDLYKSLHRKHIMAMHWFKHHCTAKYILKLDDDTFVNPFRTVEYILKIKPKGLIIHCRLKTNSGLIRNPRSKWYSSQQDYPFSRLPQFCLGFAYLTTPETWDAIYRVSETNRPMNMDDVFVSGVLAMKAMVKKTDFSSVLTYCPLNKTFDVNKLNSKAMVIDLFAKCGDLPFTKWNDINKLNK